LRDSLHPQLTITNRIPQTSVPPTEMYSYQFLHGNNSVTFHRRNLASPEQGFFEVIRTETLLSPWLHGVANALNSTPSMASSGAGGDHDDSNEMYNLFSRITHPSSRFNREMYDSVRELMFYLSHPSSRNILGDYSIRVYAYTAPAPAPELRRQSSHGLYDLHGEPTVPQYPLPCVSP
jgi:hypothetical protein